MDRRPWQLSLEAEGCPDLQDLRVAVGEVDEQAEELVVDRVKYYSRYGDQNNDQTANEYLLDVLGSSGLVEKISKQERATLTDTLHLAGSRSWGYGHHLATDGLFDAEVTTLQVPVEDEDLYVLSGLAGYDLLGRSQTLDRLVEARSETLFETSILLGGLALTLYEPKSYSVGYLGSERSGLRSLTNVGGTLHGDFHVSRRQRFVGDAIDPLGIKRPFGPALPEVAMTAYHSSEPGILAAILEHQAAWIDKNSLRDFHRNISRRLEKLQVISHGAFADYGDGDGIFEARMLEHQLAKVGNRPGGAWGSFMIDAGNLDNTMTMVSTAAGVVFRHEMSRSRGTYSDVFTLPNDEIEDFVVALFQNNFGRTSPQALERVLDVIK